MRNTGIGLIASVVAAIALAACSREGADWKSATAANTPEAYQQFLQQHPKSPNAPEAQARLKQFADDHDWQVAAAADTRDAYEQFVQQHPDSKWAQEARIRIENFAQSAASAAPVAAPAAAAVSAAPAKPAPKTVPRVAASHHAAATHVASLAPGGHYAQLGAFHTRAQAESEWKLLTSRYAGELKDLKPHYVPAKLKSGTVVYKLRVSLSSAAGARELCSALKKHSQVCVPVTA